MKEYKEIIESKKEFNYTKVVNDILGPQNKSTIINDNATATISQTNASGEDNSTNCFYKDQNKVNKRLITSGQDNDSSNMARVLTNQTKGCLLYLCQLYQNPEMLERLRRQSSSGYKTKHKKQNLLKHSSFDMMAGSSGGGVGGGFSRKRQNYEDEYPRNISSDEYDEPESNGDSGGGGANGDGVSTHKNNNNIFSYKEKMFEEDDIMDLDELKDLVNINIESTCKEHKCKYCSRRFMFEETIQEHLKTCIDFKFFEFFEEIKNLMYIKRCKEISPHEFIRRMIFSIRKTCVWLKENLIDTTLPDLLQNKDTPGKAHDVDDTHLVQNNNIETKSDNLLKSIASNENARCNPINDTNNILRVMSNSSSDRTTSTFHKVNKTVIGSSFLQQSPQPTAAVPIRQTPINISNNILFEIERSEMILKKPIARLATTTTTTTPNNIGLNNSLFDISTSKSPTIVERSHSPERLAFLEKLQKAAKTITPPPPTTASLIATTPTPVLDNLAPLIAVRQDLLETTSTSTSHTRRAAHVSPLLELLQNPTKPQQQPPNNLLLINPCARCPTCDLLFDTLDGLELHNALQHNTKTTETNTTLDPEQIDIDKEAQHKRIIALFENEDEF